MTNLTFAELTALIAVNGLTVNDRYYITDKNWTIIAITTNSYRIVVPIVTEKTYSEMAALIAASELNLALSYLITDRGDNGLLFRAAAPNRLESDGLRYMLCPATYATGADAYSNDWIGVWNTTKQASATEGQLTIWNGLVWVAGAILAGTSPDTEASGWTVIPKASFTNHEYVEMIFGVTYDFENDWICKQWDKKGNVFGLSKQDYINIYSPDDESINLIDYCDWNELVNFYNNKCHYVFNNSNLINGIVENRNIGKISNNTVPEISQNTNYGSISNNTSTYAIKKNSNTGDINDNSNNGSIVENQQIGGINQNSNEGSILDNRGMCDILLNSNNGQISNNDVRGGAIYLNSNNGDIELNCVRDSLQDNSNNGLISKNIVNGAIEYNSSLPETNCDIKFNTNNGSITGIWNANVTDPIVDKTGTAN